MAFLDVKVVKGPCRPPQPTFVLAKQLHLNTQGPSTKRGRSNDALIHEHLTASKRFHNQFCLLFSEPLEIALAKSAKAGMLFCPLLLLHALYLINWSGC